MSVRVLAPEDTGERGRQISVLMEHCVGGEACGEGSRQKKTVTYSLLRAASKGLQYGFNLEYFLGFLWIHFTAFFISNIRKHSQLIVPVTTYMKQIAWLSFWSECFGTKKNC